MSSRLFVLGAPDPEMVTIAALLDHAGQPYVAAWHDGRRVDPGTAYRTNGFSAAPPAAVGFVQVECAWADGFDPGPVVDRMDHHRPGDPGFGRPPADYWAASSLGQVATTLGLEPTPQWRLVAAADHCLAAAYRGQCPGVDPDALMAWRLTSRAAFQHRSVDDLTADITVARQHLAQAPRVMLGSVAVADLRSAAAPIPELPEAALRDGIAFLAQARDPQSGRVKTVLQSAPTEAVAVFLATARTWGHGERYGDPARGFAGVYAEALERTVDPSATRSGPSV